MHSPLSSWFRHWRPIGKISTMQTLCSADMTIANSGRACKGKLQCCTWVTFQWDDHGNLTTGSAPFCDRGCYVQRSGKQQESEMVTSFVAQHACFLGGGKGMGGRDRWIKAIAGAFALRCPGDLMHMQRRWKQQEGEMVSTFGAQNAFFLKGGKSKGVEIDKRGWLREVVRWGVRVT